MEPMNSASHDCYCLHCHTAVSETAPACAQCQAPFVGSGAFDRVSGPRPSSVFAQLFSDARGDLGA